MNSTKMLINCLKCLWKEEGGGRRGGRDDSRVLDRPFPKGTVPFRASNVPLAPPQNQQCALWLHLKTNIHLNYLDLKTVQVQTTELSEH